MLSLGQCCECDDGWSGIHCDTPICKKECIRGICIGKDKCLCDENYTGEFCNQRKKYFMDYYFKLNF